MNGNVWEWVSDLYVDRPQAKFKSSNGDTFHMVYGCGWGSDFFCPINAQSFDNTGDRFRALGFRVALTVD
jgi:formylglycine-generating enzyme required for sulfatase activity